MRLLPTPPFAPETAKMRSSRAPAVRASAALLSLASIIYQRSYQRKNPKANAIRIKRAASVDKSCMDSHECMGLKEIGALGERLVASYLVERGYEIVARNLRLGAFELDLIARRGATLIICEVKTRTRLHPGDPAAGFSNEKLERIHEAAARYLHLHTPDYKELRLDAALVLLDFRRRRARIRYLEGAL